MTIETRPLNNIGVEILGVDMTADHDATTIAELKQTWAQHGVVLFRGQSLEEADLVRFSACFGDLEIHVRREYLSKDHPEILKISNIKENGEPVGILSDHEVGWHHDQIYQAKPALGSLLYAVKIPPSGGNTAFCSLQDAYDALPDARKQALDGLKGIQSYAYFNRRWSEPTNKTQTQQTPDVIHPLIRTHPVTGRKAIYADPAMTAGIVGMAQEEAQDLLQSLYDWCLQPRFIYEHEWRLGDALMWDNASTIHRRGEFDPSTERLMKRTTILPAPEHAVPF